MYKKYIALVTISALILPLSARAPKDPFTEKLSKDDSIRHALDRLTFGPRQGDMAAVKKMGIKKWIDQQLHPERVRENAALVARLKPLDTLTLQVEEISKHYPTPQLIRLVAQGRQALPEDPVLRAAVERLSRRLRARDPNSPPSASLMAGMEPVVELHEVLSARELRTLRTGTADQKRALLKSLPEEKIDDLAVAAPPALRNQLMSVAPVELRRQFMRMTTPVQVIAFDLMEAKLSRAILSNHQLEELLVDFWYNHFNVFLDKGADRMMVPAYERDAIRPYVFGKFREMLGATAAHPAMLFYLDNWQSVGPDTPAARRARAPRGLNENYARELLELHTLGVDGGYTQKDIIEVARCFTGWSIDRPQQVGTFLYNDRVHDKGEKTVLGVNIPAGGAKEDGEKVLDIVARHPSTAKFIARKLAIRFVADNPPQALVDRLAGVFTSSGGDLRAVMKSLLDSKEFWSKGAHRAKIKTPFEMVASAARATGAELDSAFALANQIAQLGQPLYRKIEPTGYSALNSEWVNSAALISRMNFALAMTQNRIPGIKVDSAKYSGNAGAIARQVLQRDPSPATIKAMETALAEQKEKNPRAETSPALLAGLVLGSPDFQRR